jgi:hypothetical protein
MNGARFIFSLPKRIATIGEFVASWGFISATFGIGQGLRLIDRCARRPAATQEIVETLRKDCL